MNILSVNNLKKIGREEDLFINVSFGLNEGEKAAIIGRNGCGKSTLLSVIAGILPSEEGEVFINKQSGLSFLPQNPQYNNEDTIYQHIFTGTGSKLQIIKEYENICLKMQEGFSNTLQKEYDKIVATMDERNLWTYEKDVQSILTVLGIDNLQKKMGELSGGMVKKVALAKVLVDDTGLLLLDEPTNHLDLESITAVNNGLIEYKGILLFASHDHQFVETIANRIIEIQPEGVLSKLGTYDEFLEWKYAR